MEVVRVISHAQDFGHNGVLRPLCTKLLHQLHQITCGCLPNGINCGQGESNGHSSSSQFVAGGDEAMEKNEQNCKRDIYQPLQTLNRQTIFLWWVGT